MITIATVYSVPGIVPIPSYSVLTTTVGGRHYYLFSSDEETEAQSVYITFTGLHS